MELIRYLKELYSKQNKNKLRDNPKHPIYYIINFYLLFNS